MVAAKHEVAICTIQAHLQVALKRYAPNAFYGYFLLSN
jgi:hypothetical protein